MTKLPEKNLIILGAPGAGKGTQAKMLSSDFNWIHLSTGDMLREAMHHSSPLGKEAKSFVEAGDLVPDELIVDLMKDRLSHEDCKHGFILDGFPRTIKQAKKLDLVLPEIGIELDIVLSIDVADDEIVTRLSQRYTCQACGAIVTGGKGVILCPVCSGNLIRRKDDEPATIRHRLKVYSENTQPLVDYYKTKSMLFEINGIGSVEEIYNRILSAIGFSPDSL